MAKKLIRLTEGDLHRIIKESINEILSEESYRKSAKKGEHTSVANKKELNGAKRRGNNDIARKFHKFAKKHNLDKMASGARALCNYEDGCDDNGKYVANESLRKLGLTRIINESVNKVLNEARFSRFKHSSCPFFSKEEADYWDNLEFPNDEEYEKMLKMLTVYDKYNLHKKLGNDTYNAFLSRLEEDNPELYEKYINPNPDELDW